MLQCYVLMCARSVTAFMAPPRSQRPGQGPRSPHPKAGPGYVITVCVSPSINQASIFKRLISVSFSEASRFFMNILFPPGCSRNTAGHF
jgi:hypothetical protein